jgi:H+-translocating NAD(P) transhydrogenase subunit beta
MNLNYTVAVLYNSSFSLFIYGLMGLAGPKTAVRGNLIAAAGMAIAVAATLVKISDTDQWALIIAEPFTACRGG